MSPDAYKIKELVYKIDNEKFDLIVGESGLYYHGFDDDSDDENAYENWIDSMNMLYKKKKLIMRDGLWVSDFIKNKYENILKKDCEKYSRNYEDIIKVSKLEYIQGISVLFD